jgi:hypothetical protein
MICTAKKIGKGLIKKEYYIKDLIFQKYVLKIILQHEELVDMCVDFGLNVMDFRFSHELNRVNDFVLDEKIEYWPVLHIKDSNYLKKLDQDSLNMILSVNEDLKHYVVFDDDFVIDILSSKEPKIYEH